LDVLDRGAGGLNMPEGSTFILCVRRGAYEYTGARYRAKVEAAKIELSMSRPCLPYDNAIAESFFATLKLELADDKLFESRDVARMAVFKYVELFYNRVRMHSALGYRSPMQAEREYQPVRLIS